MVRSDDSPLAAVDKIEYVETGAMYEYRDRAAGQICEGLTLEQSQLVVAAFGVRTQLY
jgi:rhamnulose-1-phosphate aldolase